MDSWLKFGLSGPDSVALLRAVGTLPPFAESPPLRLRIDVSEPKITRDWKEQCIRETTIEMFADWDEDPFSNNKWVSYRPRANLVKASLPDFPQDPADVLSLLAPFSFELASFRAPHLSDWMDKNYEHYGFGRAHFSHGWACAFKGTGHGRLVSRRWLDFGPWRVLRGPDDTTLVQFHELGIDSETAFAQANPGHKRMGIDDSGGFLQQHYVYEHEFEGVYEKNRGVLKIVIHGREVSQCEMLDACALRYYRADALDPPLKNIGFVFMVPEVAYAHLHELWLRELECWTFIDGKETRIDLDYNPTPEKPAWVKRLEAGSGAAP